MTRIVSILVLIYLLGYVGLRIMNTETWSRDGETYVIFPAEPLFLYYIYRPMTYLDNGLTGMRFHIGPHN